jgi:hypothetical protein
VQQERCLNVLIFVYIMIEKIGTIMCFLISLSRRMLWPVMMQYMRQCTMLCDMQCKTAHTAAHTTAHTTAHKTAHKTAHDIVHDGMQQENCPNVLIFVYIIIGKIGTTMCFFLSVCRGCKYVFFDVMRHAALCCVHQLRYTNVSPRHCTRQCIISA